MKLDFGYPWYLSYGHLVVTVVMLAFWLLGRSRHWRKAPMLLIALVGAWSIAAFFVARFSLDVNGRLSFPTQNFISSGRVLDMGAGTGRSTIMVLESRPQTNVVALDLFGQSFKQHFGPGQSGQERLLQNLKAAGVDTRATIATADMRKLPFDAASFDGIVSTYAIDHLGRYGVPLALGEASRVLKPGGQFFMMVISKDSWLKFAFGPLLLHSGTRSAGQWASLMENTGLQVAEQGTVPGTLWFLARKR